MDRACEETDKGLYRLLLITMFSRHWIFAPNHPEGIQNTPYFSETPCQWKIHSDHWRSEISFSQVSDVDSSVCSHPGKNCYNTCGWEVGGGKICLFSWWAVTNRGIRNLGRGKLIWVKIAAKKLRTTLNKRSFQTCIWCCWNILHPFTHPLCYPMPQRLIPVSFWKAQLHSQAQ